MSCEKRGMNNVARLARRILSGLALTALAASAQAQVVSGSYRSMTKTDAILGGAPSALAAITSQQGGRPLYSSYVVPAARNAAFSPSVSQLCSPGHFE